MFLPIILLSSLAISAHGNRLHVESFAPEVPRTYQHNVLEVPSSLLLEVEPTFSVVVDEPAAVGINFARQWLREQAASHSAAIVDFVIKNSYTSDNGVTHIYLRQIQDGLEVSFSCILASC